MDIVLVKSDQRGEAHEYYDILIHCQLPPALAEELMAKINKSLEIKQRIEEEISRIDKEHKQYEKNGREHWAFGGCADCQDIKYKLQELLK